MEKREKEKRKKVLKGKKERRKQARLLDCQLGRNERRNEGNIEEKYVRTDAAVSL